MGIFVGCRARAATAVAAASIGAMFICLVMSAVPDAQAQEAGGASEIQRDEVATTEVIIRSGTEPSDRDDVGSADDHEADEKTGNEDFLMTASSLWNSVPTRGWLKFLDREDKEYAGKEISVTGQESYVMPSLDGIPSVEYHAGKGVSGNADWSPVAWVSQWFDVDGRCDKQWGYDVCTIKSHGGFTPPTIFGSLKMRRFRPGDRVAAPTATGSASWWGIYHRSWAVYAQQIRYAPNGGTGTMRSTAADVSGFDLNSGTYHLSVPATLANNEYTRAGYRFVGWKSRGTGSMWQPGDTRWLSLSDNPTSEFSEYLIFDAQWEQLPQTTTMPSTGGHGLVTAYAAGAGLCGVGFGGIVGIARKRDKDPTCGGNDESI